MEGMLTWFRMVGLYNTKISCFESPQQKELHEEIGKYCADLKATRQEEMRLKGETERIIQQEMNKAAEKETQLRKAQAAASKRLLCDVIAGQKIQREEKCE